MSLWPGLLLITFVIGGITLKLADYYGETGSNILQYFFAIASALFFGLLISNDSYSSSIILGIIVGVALSKKVDRPNLVLGLILTLLIAGVFGFSYPLPWLLIIVSIFSFIDEFCHDKFTANKDHLTLFFRFRPLLKLVMLFLAIISLVETIYTLGFLSFDLAYDTTNWLLTSRRSKTALN